MNKGALTVLLVLFAAAPARAAAGAGDLRARAAQDLVCKAVKIQDWGQKVEARGCGRNAEYERTESGLDLVMLELAIAPEMRRQAMADLGCSTVSQVELTRTFTKELGEQLTGSGCGRDIAYDVENGVLKLKSVTRPAPPEIVAKVAADLSCPTSIEVTLTRDGTGAETASAYDCKGERQFFRFTLEPFQRQGGASSTAVETKAPTTTTVLTTEGDVGEVARVQGLKERAAKDLGCAQAVSVNLTKTDTKVGEGIDSDLKAMEAVGCGRHAKYERRGSDFVLTYVEKAMRPEWTEQVAREMECPADKLDIHLFAFPDKGTPDALGVKGCDRQGSYAVSAAGPKLVYQISQADAATTAAIAKDLGCGPDTVHVDLIRREAKGPWSAVGSCRGGHQIMYNLNPLKRIGRAPEAH